MDINYLYQANCGKDRNASQFIITLGPQKHLDGKHVAFGHVVEGMETLSEIENVFCVGGRPTQTITIQSTGVMKLQDGKWIEASRVEAAPLSKAQEEGQQLKMEVGADVAGEPNITPQK